LKASIFVEVGVLFVKEVRNKNPIFEPAKLSLSQRNICQI